MKSASGSLAILATLALILATIPAPAATQDEPPPPEPAPAPRALETPYDHTAISAVVRANRGRVPRSGAELVAALKKIGDFAQLPVTFSAVALDSGLTHPRVIIAPRAGVRESEDGFAVPQEVLLAQPALLPPNPLSPAGVTAPNLEGRLFFAANMHQTGPGEFKVKTLEFISWNSRKKRFDFGVIECGTEEPEIKFLDGMRCFACHKNRGPILGSGPWSNTTNNDVVRLAAFNALGPHAIPFNPGAPVSGTTWTQTIRSNGQLIAMRERTTFDGMSLVIPEPEVCDAAVRQGGDLVRDRAIYKAMLRAADGRKAFTLMLGAVVDPQPIQKSYERVKQPLDLAFNITSAAFGNEVVAIHKVSSDTLADYSPSGSVGTLRNVITNTPAGWGGGSFLSSELMIVWGGDAEKVTAYDARRANGEHGMPSHRQPSNPKAFVRPASVPVPPRPSAAVSAASLARAMGLTEGDRQFLAKTLADTARRINKPKVTAATLARDVFNGPGFMELLKAGDIPDREEFKDRFIAGLNELAKAHKLSGGLGIARADYASGPNPVAVLGAEENEPAVVPTTSCLRCHDIRGIGKPSFNPIPMLAFDPFDKQARATWVSNNTAKARQAVLGRMLQRLVTDKDMPPEDSPEAEMFRAKDPASFDAVKDWLEAELKKAK